MYVPEGRLDPPDGGLYVLAGCGHEIYPGQELYEWEEGGTICSDCLEDKFREMSLSEKADLLGCDRVTVLFEASDEMKGD